MRVRIIAVKTELRDLRPGDLYSEYDGSYWNLAMSGHVPPQALICTNVADAEDISKDSLHVYKLTIVKEGTDKEGNKFQQRDAHTSVLLDPNAPPGSTPKEIGRDRKRSET
jgi:hypothetical protein